MRKLLIAVLLALAGVAAAPASARADVAVTLGINIPAYPRLVPVPGYPVYYAPNLDQNYFFYDGYYWLFYGDNWYESQWYNGPWGLVPPDYVPPYVLRVPVRYYYRPPAFFGGWAPDEPPRWGRYWGPGWAERHRDWDRWDRHRMPQRAPLPSYQRHYFGDRYPGVERQREEQARNYRYTPRDYVQHQQHLDRLMQRETSPNRVPAGHGIPPPGVPREQAAWRQQRIESQTGQQWHGNQPDPRRGSGPADSGGG